MVDPAAVAANVDVIRQRIRQAGGTDAVEILAVTKTFPIAAITCAVAAGCRSIGENYAQELLEKAPMLPPRGCSERPEVHFIGHLQSNKVRQLAAIVDVWQTLDRPSVIDEVALRCPGARVYVQVNVTGEAQKSGCQPAVAGELVRRCTESGLRVEGLMTLGASGDPTVTVSGFEHLARLAEKFGVVGRSMGMSGDLEAAVGAGSTMVRIGSALFGHRDG
jgi:PLP dependent protein